MYKGSQDRVFILVWVRCQQPRVSTQVYTFPGVWACPKLVSHLAEKALILERGHFAGCGFASGYRQHPGPWSVEPVPSPALTEGGPAAREASREAL